MFGNSPMFDTPRVSAARVGEQGSEAETDPDAAGPDQKTDQATYDHGSPTPAEECREALFTSIRTGRGGAGPRVPLRGPPLGPHPSPGPSLNVAEQVFEVINRRDVGAAPGSAHFVVATVDHFHIVRDAEQSPNVVSPAGHHCQPF